MKHQCNNTIIIIKMNSKKKQKKTFLSKWKKKGMADGLSTTFFELKLQASPEPAPASFPSLQEPLVEERKEGRNDQVRMEAPLHLINVII
jgi:hypothetical protein